MGFMRDWRIKKQKISQNVVYSKNCISLKPNSTSFICTHLNKNCEYRYLTNLKRKDAYRLITST